MLMKNTPFRGLKGSPSGTNNLAFDDARFITEDMVDTI